MGWIYDFFHKKNTSSALNDSERILCEIYRRKNEGALSILEIVSNMDNINMEQYRYNFLQTGGYIRPWMLHGKHRTYLITKSGILKAKELLGIKGEDGLPILGDH